MDIATSEVDAIIAQLCVILHCLPSELKKESYNDVENLIVVLQAQAKRQKKDAPNNF